MLEQVENKIKELKEQQRKEYLRKKEANLSDWGLKKGSKGKPQPVVTDEEYESLLEAASGTSEAGSNKIAKQMNFCSGFVIALGIVIAIIAAISAESLGFLYFSVIVFGAILLALLFRGIGEGIRLMQQLIDLKSIEEKAEKSRCNEAPSKAFPDSQPSSEQQFANAPPVHQAFTTVPIEEETPFK